MLTMLFMAVCPVTPFGSRGSGGPASWLTGGDEQHTRKLTLLKDGSLKSKTEFLKVASSEERSKITINDKNFN
jgi:hypothetical protein